MQSHQLAHKKLQVEEQVELKHRQQEAAVTQLHLLQHQQQQLHSQQAQIKQREQRAQLEQQQSAALQWQLKKLEEKRDMQLHMLAHEHLKKEQSPEHKRGAAVHEKPVVGQMQLQQASTVQHQAHVTQAQRQAVLKWNLQQLQTKRDTQIHLLQLVQQWPEQQNSKAVVGQPQQSATKEQKLAQPAPTFENVATKPSD